MEGAIEKSSEFELSDSAPVTDRDEPVARLVDGLTKIAKLAASDAMPSEVADQVLQSLSYAIVPTTQAA